jgi:hypothetical protein
MFITSPKYLEINLEYVNPERIFGIQKKHMTYTQQIIENRNLKVGTTFIMSGVTHTIASIDAEAGEMVVKYINFHGNPRKYTHGISGFESQISYYGFITEINGRQVGK